MTQKGEKDRFSNDVELIRHKYPTCPETERFTYYDNRGLVIYQLLSDINMEIVQLHDEVRNNVFSDIDYYQIVDILPMWLRDAGNSQESAMSKEFFEKLVASNNNYLVNKILYYHDCEMLVNALQNRFNIVEAMLTQVYTILTPVLKYDIKGYDNVIFTIDDSSQRVNAFLNSIFINLASSCDIATKIAYELSNMDMVDFSTYPKMKSSDILYGKWKKLPAELKHNGTYFTDPRLPVVAKVESIRDEIVHNGSLDFHATIYYGVKSEEIEKWILMPEFNNDGTLASYLRRKKFYNDASRTFNKELPILVGDFLNVSLATIGMIRKRFSKAYYSNPNDLGKYQGEIKALTTSFVKIAMEELKQKTK